jgi:thiamine-monophosphate kinase
MGDDAAAVRISPEKTLLLTTDLLVEGIDFDLALSSYDQIGYKALAANLSDIAAMGGVARFFLVSLAVPSSTPVSAVDNIYRGMRRLAKRFDVVLIGGDTSSSAHGIFLNLTVAGEIEPSRLVRRSGARTGDWIFVTGNLGASRAGLEILRSQAKGSKLRAAGRRSQAKTKKLAAWNLQLETLIHHHLYPTPRLKEGRLIASKGLATAMMDLSDGLASDLHRLCESSRVGALIDLASLPVSSPLETYALRREKSPSEYALAGGEDFELLFTVPPASFNRLAQLRKRERIKITQIGQIRPRHEGIRLLTKDRGTMVLKAKGYEHFRVNV